MCVCVCVCVKDLTLNHPQRLTCRRTPSKTKPIIHRCDPNGHSRLRSIQAAYSPPY